MAEHIAPHRVGILIFDQVELLDFAGPFEVFAAARQGVEPGPMWRDAPQPFEVITLAPDARAVESSGGLRIEPHATIADHPPLEIIVVPGGFGVRALIDPPDQAILEWVRSAARSASLLTSVCTGAWVLAAAGLLRDRPATTHGLGCDMLLELDPSIRVQRSERIVDDGNVITAAGVSAGVDMALHVVQRIAGESCARATAKYIEYPWPREHAVASNQHAQ